MDSIEDLERELPGLLRRAAERMPVDGRRLGLVDPAVSVSRRGWTHRVALAGCAAVACAAVAAGVVSVRDDGQSVAAIGGPSSSVAASELDAVLVTLVYPNAVDPEFVGEWAVLETEGGTYYANGPASGFTRDSVSNPNRLADAFEALEATRQDPPATAAATVVEASTGASLSGLGDEGQAWDASAVAEYEFRVLTRLIASGRAGAGEAADLRRLLESVPGVTVAMAGDSTVVVSYGIDIDGVSFSYDATSGRPLRSTASTDPTGDVLYVSVIRVRSSDYLQWVPARVSPSSPSTTAPAYQVVSPTPSAGGS